MPQCEGCEHLTSEIIRDLARRPDLSWDSKKLLVQILIERNSPYLELEEIAPAVARIENELSEEKLAREKIEFSRMEAEEEKLANEEIESNRMEGKE